MSTKLWWFSAAVILSHLLVEDVNGWFFRPVSEVVRDYDTDIAPALPSDLGTVWCRLMQRKYDSHSEKFVEDVRRIWLNCRKYNGDHASVSVEAMRLASVFEASWVWLLGSDPQLSGAVKSGAQDGVDSVAGAAGSAETSSVEASAPKHLPLAVSAPVVLDSDEENAGEEWLPRDADGPAPSFSSSSATSPSAS